MNRSERIGKSPIDEISSIKAQKTTKSNSGFLIMKLILFERLERTCTYVVTIVAFVEADLLCEVVCLVDSTAKSVCHGCDTEDSSAV